MLLWLFCPGKEEKWAVNTKPYSVSSAFSLSPYIHADLSKPSISLLHMFLFRSHIFHCSSPKSSRNTSWKGAVISLLFLWGSYHNSERPSQACDLQGFATFSCTRFILTTFEIKSSIPADTTHMRKIFFAAGFEMEERPVRIKNMLH